DEFDLLMIEQPLAAGDLVDHAKLQRKLKTPICLDESITCLADAKHAIESGIGRAHNIAMSTLSGFTLPGDVSASERYWHEDIIDPPVTVNNKGVISVPDAPGIGYSVKEDVLGLLTTRHEQVDCSPLTTV